MDVETVVATSAPFILKAWAVALLLTGIHWGLECLDVLGENSKRYNSRYSLAFMFNVIAVLIWSFFMTFYILCDFR